MTREDKLYRLERRRYRLSLLAYLIIAVLTISIYFLSAPAHLLPAPVRELPHIHVLRVFLLVLVCLFLIYVYQSGSRHRRLLRRHAKNRTRVFSLSRHLREVERLERFSKTVLSEAAFEKVIRAVLDATAVKGTVLLLLHADREIPRIFTLDPGSDGGVCSGVLPLRPEIRKRLEASRKPFEEGSHLWVPMRAGERPTGALRAPAEDLTEEARRFLVLLAPSAGLAISKTLVYEKTRRALEELRSKQEQLLHIEKLSALGELTSGIAHEMKNPLTGILGYADLLLASGLENSHRKDVEKIRAEVIRMNQIVDNLVSFAREKKIEKSAGDINEILSQAIRLLILEIQSRDIDLRKEMEKGPLDTAVDAFQIQQVFYHLLRNAIEALEEKREGEKVLSVRTRKTPRVIIAEIEDNGPGVPSEIRSRIFDPFFTTRSVGSASGLGLSLCHGILGQHGGSIRLEDGPGGETRFIVEIPLLISTGKGGDPDGPSTSKEV